MDKVQLHRDICNKLNQTYEKKSHDYGDSFNETFNKLGIVSAITRITDKYNRLVSLCTLPDTERQVKDESISDTLLDMANYCIMTEMELHGHKNNNISSKKEPQSLQPSKEYNMNIRTVYIDLDCCTLNTIKCITDLYDEDYCYYPTYKKIDWKDIHTYNFTELNAAKSEYLNLYFNQKRFFDKVEMLPNAKETIDLFYNFYGYNIVFVSSGYAPNLKLKEEYIKKNFPYAKFIGVNLEKYKDKSHIDMSNGIFIDDDPNNLKTSNAAIKICFGNYDWNKDISSVNFNESVLIPTWELVNDFIIYL